MTWPCVFLISEQVAPVTNETESQWPSGSSVAIHLARSALSVVWVANHNLNRQLRCVVRREVPIGEMMTRGAISTLNETRNHSFLPSVMKKTPQSVNNPRNDRERGDFCPSANTSLPRRAAEPGVWNNRCQESSFGSRRFGEASAVKSKR
jgi:hypothetical protein